MPKQRQLLVSDLVLSSQNDHQCAPGSAAFGLPFKFGQDLVFPRRDCATEYGTGVLQPAGHGCRVTPAQAPLKASGRLSFSQKQSDVSNLADTCQPGSYSLPEGSVGQWPPCSQSQAHRALGALGVAMAHGTVSAAVAAATVQAILQSACRFPAYSGTPEGLASPQQIQACDRVAGTCNSVRRSLQDPIKASLAIASLSGAWCGYPQCRGGPQRLLHLRQSSIKRQLDPDPCFNNGPQDVSCSKGRGPSSKKRTACSQKPASNERQGLPGPGSYNVSGGFGQGPAFSIAGRPAQQQQTVVCDPDLPGPGHYHDSRSKGGPSGPAYTIAPRWKEAGVDAAGPGPGEHQQLKFIADGPAFTVYAKRTASPDRHAGSCSPGPGSYAPDWDSSAGASGPSFTIAGRQQDKAGRTAMPGPADYQQNMEFRPDGPSHRFPPTASTKPRRTSDALVAAPAPGDYNTANINAMGTCGPAWTIPAVAAKPCHAAAAEQQLSASPGPGHYHKVNAGPRGPAFSMGSKPDSSNSSIKGQKQQEQVVPGPGDYHRELSSGGPAFSIAAKPDSPGLSGVQIDPTPGPGHYHSLDTDAATAAHAPAFTIGVKLDDPRGKSALGAQVGPGAYDIPQEPEGPCYTIGGKWKRTGKTSDAPGVGTYNLQPTLPEGPCFTMGARVADSSTAPSRVTDIGGPGEYEVVDSGGMAVDGPAWTMGVRRTGTGEGQAASSPGPGQYHKDSSGQLLGPAWSMGSRPRPSDDAASGGSPGPGDYAPLSVLGAGDASGPAFTMAGRWRDMGNREDCALPGPGSYLPVGYADPGALVAPAFTIGTRRGADRQAAEVAPGPGAYEVPELPAGAAFTISGRHPAEDKDPAAELPGPASYDLAGATTVAAATAPSWTMGARVAAPAADTAASGPAPGDYSPADPSAASAPAWTMSAKCTDSNGATSQQQQLLPGPGQYNPADPVKDASGPAFSMGVKWKAGAVDPSAADTPAPGEYDVANDQSGPAFTMGTREAAGSSAEAAAGSLPGPGQYHQPSQPGKDAPACSIASKAAAEPRSAAGSAAGFPGPGEYDQLATWQSGPAYSMAGKALETSGAAGKGDGPGPGQYDVGEAGPEGPCYTMAGKLLSRPKAAEGPAPGDYCPEEAAASTLPAAPAFTMASKPFQVPLSADALEPGPGDYHCTALSGPPPHAAASPAFSIRGKHRLGKSRLQQLLGPKLAALDKMTPAPGEHQAPTGAGNVRPGLAFSFAGAQRAAGDGNAAGVAAEAVDQAIARRSTSQSLAQLQAQLARLLMTDTKRGAHDVAAAAAVERQKDSKGGSSSKPTAIAATSLAAAAAAAQPSLLHACEAPSVGSSLKTKKAVKAHQAMPKGRSSSNREILCHKLVSPGPGEYHQDMSAAAGAVGVSGPAFTISARSTTGNTMLVQRQGSSSVATAEGLAVVLAAAAAADRAAGVPGPGAYNVNGYFPKAEGATVHKPILKKKSSHAISAAAVGSALKALGGQQSPLLSSTRRVSWADQTY